MPSTRWPTQNEFENFVDILFHVSVLEIFVLIFCLYIMVCYFLWGMCECV